MTLDEAINTLEHGIEQLTMELKSGLWEVGSDTENAVKEGIKDNEQLIAWLIELKEAKRLLRAAVEDMHIEDMCDVCVERIPNSPIHCPDGSDCFVWRYKDEALKLIGED